MDLTAEEVERYLNRIFTGTELFNYNDRLLIFKQPTNELKAKADLVFDKALKRAVDLGMLRLVDLEALIRKRNIFTDEDQDSLDQLLVQRDAQEVILSKTTKIKASQDRLKKIIADLNAKIL